MKTARKNLLIALAAALAVTLIAGSGVLRRLDKWVQDRLFQQPSITSSDIVIIGIDEKALADLGAWHSWNRNFMASALETLAGDPDYLPAVAAVDTLN